MRAYAWPILALLAGIGMAAISHGADDDYLKALKAETEALSGSQTAPAPAPAAPGAKTKQEWAADKQGMGDEVPPNLTQEQFESALKSSFFGTYVFYMKLNEADKAKVYTAYQSNGQISHIRDTTTSLMKK